MFCKKDVLENFAKFTGRRLRQSLFFNKVAGLRPATLLKKRLWRRCFSVIFVKFLRTPFFTEHLWWLLLFICSIYTPFAAQFSRLVRNLKPKEKKSEIVNLDFFRLKGKNSTNLKFVKSVTLINKLKSNF